MKSFSYSLAIVITVVTIIVWTLVTVLGGAEILWWIFTGDFFHFISGDSQVANTF